MYLHDGMEKKEFATEMGKVILVIHEELIYLEGTVAVVGMTT